MSQNKANRKSVRAPIVPSEISGIVTVAGREDHIPALIWDVSEQGLGLWLAEKVNPNDQIKLSIGQPFAGIIEGSIKWVSPDQHSGFRCGLELKARTKELLKLYAHFKLEMERGS